MVDAKDDWTNGDTVNASDFNALAAEVNAIGGSTIFLDEFTPDPTGTSFSDTALAAAVAELGSSPGQIKIGRAGNYKFTGNYTFQQQQSFIGPDESSCILKFSGTGDFIRIQDTRSAGAQFSYFPGGASGPGLSGRFAGFLIDGTGATSTPVGIHAGDISAPNIDCAIINFSASGGVGLKLHNAVATWSERARVDVRTGNCATGVVLDSSSFMYSWFNISVDCAPNQHGVVVQNAAIVAQCPTFCIVGNYTAGSPNTGIGLQVKDTAQLTGHIQHLGETNSGTGSVGHKFITVASGASVLGYGAISGITGSGPGFSNSDSTTNSRLSSFRGIRYVDGDSIIGQNNSWHT